MQQYTDALEFYMDIISPNNADKSFVVPAWAVDFAERYAEHRATPPPSSHQGNLVVALDEYIDLLGKEIDSLVDIASVHGWESSNYEAGEILRKKISQLRFQPAPPTPVEGPWSWQVVGSRINDERGDEYDEYYELTDGKTTFYIDGGEDDDSFDKLVQLLNDHKIKLDFDHGAEFLAYEFERMYKEAVEQRPQWMHTDWHRPEKAGYYFVDVEQIGKRVWGKRKIIHEAENGRRFYWLSDSPAPEQVDPVGFAGFIAKKYMVAVNGWPEDWDAELAEYTASLQNKQA